MIYLKRTNAEDPDFIDLVKQLDADLAERDGEDHSFYAQFNTIVRIPYAIVLYEKDTPIGCGAIKEYDPNTMEVKRMYTLPASRGKGIATQILTELEQWAAELSYKRCILETGKRQPEAIKVYTKNGYNVIPNYGQYEKIDNSVCFEKHLLEKGKQL